MKNVTEFWCLWMELSQHWVVVFGNGDQLSGFPAVGYATQAAYRLLGRGEVEFACTLDTGEAYHFEKDEEFWRTHA